MSADYDLVSIVDNAATTDQDVRSAVKPPGHDNTRCWTSRAAGQPPRNCHGPRRSPTYRCCSPVRPLVIVFPSGLRFVTPISIVVVRRVFAELYGDARTVRRRWKPFDALVRPGARVVWVAGCAFGLVDYVQRVLQMDRGKLCGPVVIIGTSRKEDRRIEVSVIARTMDGLS